MVIALVGIASVLNAVPGPRATGRAADGRVRRALGAELVPTLFCARAPRTFVDGTIEQALQVAPAEDPVDPDRDAATPVKAMVPGDPLNR